MLKDAGQIEERYVKEQNSNKANVVWLGETFLEFVRKLPGWVFL